MKPFSGAGGGESPHVSGSENLEIMIPNDFEVILARDDVGCDGDGEDGGEAEGDADDGDDAALLLLDDGGQGRVLRHGAPPLLGGHMHHVTAEAERADAGESWRLEGRPGNTATLLRWQMEIGDIIY